MSSEGAGIRCSVSHLVEVGRNVPFLHSIDLKIDPPDARNA